MCLEDLGIMSQLAWDNRAAFVTLSSSIILPKNHLRFAFRLRRVTAGANVWFQMGTGLVANAGTEMDDIDRFDQLYTYERFGDLVQEDVYAITNSGTPQIWIQEALMSVELWQAIQKRGERIGSGNG